MLELSKLAPGPKLTLHAVAEVCDDDGFAEVGRRYLMRRTGATRNTVKSHLRAAMKEGELALIRAGDGNARSRVRVLLDIELPARREGGSKVDPPGGIGGGQKLTPGGSEIAPPRACEDRENPKPLSGEANASPPPQPRKPDPVWDALVDVFGPVVERNRSGRGRVVSDLKELARHGGLDDPELVAAEVRRRHAALEREWGSRATARSLVEHWATAGKLADRFAPGGDDVFAEYDR